jgi:hypothetical protein
VIDSREDKQNVLNATRAKSESDGNEINEKDLHNDKHGREETEFDLMLHYFESIAYSMRSDLTTNCFLADTVGID